MGQDKLCPLFVSQDEPEIPEEEEKIEEGTGEEEALDEETDEEIEKEIEE